MSDINEIKRLIAESEGLELSNWNTATHAQREAWASIETQGRAWIIDFITTIESQNSEIESLKAIKELAVKGLRYVISFPFLESTEDIRIIKRNCSDSLDEIKELQNGTT